MDENYDRSTRVTVRARVANTYLPWGVDVEVNRTDVIEALLKGGWIEVVDDDD